VIFSIIALNSAFAVTDPESKTESSDPVTEKKIKSTDKEEAAIAKDATKVEDSKTDNSIIPYHQASIFEIEENIKGEDQNAVITFNFIQYFFKTFKFSEEVY